MKISIQSLKQGLTRFSEKIPPDFIEKSYSNFYPEDFFVNVEVDKFERDIRLKLVVKSTANYKCDSCLKDFESNIEIQQQQMYEIGPAPEENSDHEIIYLTRDTIELDLTNLLNEGVVLNHPIKMQCSDNCKGLCPGCGVDLNLEQCICEEGDIDPRWEKLRKLIK
ncbi:MAG: DUF177 domain-containing protein [Calditrichaeota bacterium]|nr:MAG: DUF177 domain-containing protein [Calditrichota bacterium]MBL1203775.1 DUF177 domain-containing protein [Calditrichota bacterium]NOG43605.1 DUF177 domain-containing protein [Calditrichota bacterium]